MSGGVMKGNIIGVPNDNTKIYILDPQENYII
jgi:hypothetical protein